MGLHQLVRVGRRIQTKITNISLAAILSMSGLAGSAPLFLTQKAAAAGVTDHVVINEIVSSLSSGTEWVELYNPTPNPVDISDWRLRHNSASTNFGGVFDQGTIIAPHSYYVHESTVSVLPDGGATLHLCVNNACSTDVDTVTYPALTSAESYGRLYNAASTLQIFSSPTKNANNLSPAATLSSTYVVEGGSGTDCTDVLPCGSINSAIARTSIGGTVNVAAGRYQEDVNINKAVTALGAGAESTRIVGTTGNASPLFFSSNNATVSGFTITHEYTSAELDAWTFNNNGVTFGQLTSGNVLEYSTVSLNRNGVYLNNSTGNIIRNNTITNNRTGINMTNGLAGTQITGNTISENWTVGLVSYYSGIPTDYSLLTVSGNTFDNNWYSEVLVKDTSSSTGTLNVTGNTFTDNPVTYTTSANASLNEPGFSAQKPVELEGSAVKPTDDLPTLRIYNNPSVSLQYDLPKTLNVGSGHPYSTIQSAITDASSGDTISVGPGTYTETVNVNKSLNILGAQSGVDARARSTQSETVMNAAGGAFSVTANNVSIDGFTIQGATGAPLGTGISLGNSTSGVQVRNNIIENNVFGLYLNGQNQTVEQNLFQNNNQPGSATGDAIYSDHGLQNSVVENNLFTGHSSAAIVVAGASNSNISFSNNELQNDNSVVFFNSLSVLIEDNHITNTDGSAIFLGGGNNGVTIHGNVIVGDNGSPSTGISISNSSTSPNQNVDITGNTMTGRGRGINLAAGSYSGTLDVNLNSLVGNNLASTNAVEINNAAGVTINANNNWWGSNLGPSSSLFLGSVTADSWCADDTCTPPFLSASGGITTLPADEPIDLSGLLAVSGNTATVEFPNANNVVVTTATSTGSVTVQIEKGTVVQSSSTWDGIITPPTVQSSSSVSVPTTSGFVTTVATVIEVGSSEETLTFDNPVRLFIPGQGNSKIGFIRAGEATFNEITTPCLDDTLAGAIAAIIGNGECKVKVGNDMVVWTKHFTKFVTYTTAPTPVSGGSSAGNTGSASSASSTTTAKPAFTPAFAAAATDVLGSTSTAPQTSSTNTGVQASVAQAKAPLKSSSGKVLGLNWYWWVVILAAAGAALYGIYRMADTTERTRR